MRGAAQKQRTALGNIAESGQAVPHAGPVLPRVGPSLTSRANRLPEWENARVGQETPQSPRIRRKRCSLSQANHMRTERFQISCGRVIRVVSVFPKQGTETPADKLKALAELEFQQGKMCA